MIDSYLGYNPKQPIGLRIYRVITQSKLLVTGENPKRLKIPEGNFERFREAGRAERSGAEPKPREILDLFKIMQIQNASVCVVLNLLFR